MRRNHMDLIVHQRDDTVIRGIRDEPFSLVECVDCHVQRDAENKHIRVDEEGQFCAGCHSFVAAKIDCFSCHAAVPDTNQEESVDGNHWIPNKRLMALSSRFSAPLKRALGHDQNEPRTAKPD
ncbi:MAG: cytochrome c3 family protein [Granulosicoccaceae bacterium]